MRKNKENPHNWRNYSASTTLKKITPFFNEFGITRLANITGLDRLGVPVYAAYRPLSRTICVSAGKGNTLEDAKVSASMESIELYHAETIKKNIIFNSYENISQQLILPYDLLPLSKNSIFEKSQIHPWIFGKNIISNQKILVPFEYVSINPSDKKINLPVFQSSTNGLASGNTNLEATVSALLEVIERDGTTISIELSKRGIEQEYIDEQSIEYDSIQKLLNIFKNNQIETLLINCTTEIEIPIFICILFDKKRPNLGGFMGAGCHLDSQIALERAINEACQSRAIFFSGSRDDLLKFKHDYIKNTFPPLSSLKKIKKKPLIPIKFKDFRVQKIYKKIITQLKKNEISYVITVDLTKSKYGIPVKKLFIPELENYLSASYTAGKRLKKIVQTR